MNNNEVFSAIYTDRALANILANFSEDYIEDVVTESLIYKFRPYTTRMPNFPLVLNQTFADVVNRAPSYTEQINKRREEVFEEILMILCNNYQLVSEVHDIPEEHLYPLCYLIYPILVSEFSKRMIEFFSNYIVMNCNQLLGGLREEKKSSKVSYAKKIYDSNSADRYIALYDNFEEVLDIVAGLDIPFAKMMEYLSDNKTAQLITNYIEDGGDFYKYHIAKYITDPTTRTDMITTIKLNIVSITGHNNAIIDPINSPYFV